jgi:hypothetical protein
VIDLTGTFTIDGNTLTFQDRTTVIPEVPWTIGNGTLTDQYPSPREP